MVSFHDHTLLFGTNNMHSSTNLILTGDSDGDSDGNNNIISNDNGYFNIYFQIQIVLFMHIRMSE